MPDKKKETIGTRIIRSLGLTRTKTARKSARRAYQQGWKEAVDISANDDPADASLGIAAGGFGYKKASSGGSREGDVQFDENIRTAWQLWQSNGILQRDAEINRDYAVGGIISVETEDENLQEVLDSFVESNKLWRRIGEFTLQLGVLGAQVFPAFVRDSDGSVSIGYIDPEEIELVVPNPEDAMEMVAIVIKARHSTHSWDPGSERRVYRIIGTKEVGGEHDGRLTSSKQANIHEWEEIMLSSFGLQEYTGDCFYIKTNSFSNQTTGYSDFLAAADLADQWDQTLFAIGQREQLAGFFSFDVTMTGADEEDCRDRAKGISESPPKPGSALVHNESETWQMFSPDLKQQPSVLTVQEQLKNIIAILGKPEAWFGSSSGAYLATVQAQGDPTWRSLRYRQNEIRYLLEDMFNFVRDQAVIAGSYIQHDNETNTEISVQMPDMTSDDITPVSTAMSAITSSLMIWEERGWIDKAVTQKVLNKIINELGISISSEELDIEYEPIDRKLSSPGDWFSVNSPFSLDD